MKIADFGVEIWMNEYETRAKFNIAETCVESMTVHELLALCGDEERHLEVLRRIHLTYGDIPGSERLRGAVASLYKGRSAEEVLITDGGIGSNFIALWSFVEPGDEVVALLPTYQQLYALPESFGARVTRLRARRENAFRPDVEELRRAVTHRTRLIVLNYPNNPTGASLDEDAMREIVAVADRVGAWILCDEIYRGLEHQGAYGAPSFTDLYPRAIGTGSLSKVYSLAGLRTGWIVAPREFLEECSRHRDYTTISCGRVNDYLAALALEHRDRVLERNLALVRSNAAVLGEWVRQEPLVSWTAPRAGTTALLRFQRDQGSEAFCRELFDATGTMLVPGSCFEFSDCSARIGFAPHTETLRGGLGALSAFLHA
ncbi:MAG TPA: aminotransferase class I/II-fold pyridoxal phosphate-dependent enzyme [Synergistaceae bacterium]|nr:aminotransferase class I/II-fold pyridoxal phosphate-dependent enzyme [Synergistaceae bacterium]